MNTLKSKNITINLKTSNKARRIKDRLKQADSDDRYINIANAVEKIQHNKG